MSNDALINLQIALDARIAERLAHYDDLLTNGETRTLEDGRTVKLPPSGETLAEIFEFLKLVMPQATPAQQPSHEPRHWKRGAVDRLDANPNNRIEFHDNP